MKLIIFPVLMAILVSFFRTAAGGSLDTRLAPIVRPYLFNIAGWEMRTVPYEIKNSFFSRQAGDGTAAVREYFALTQRIAGLKSQIERNSTPAIESELAVVKTRRSALEATVELTLEKQIAAILTEEGIYNPLNELKFSFPPVNFKLETPPHILVISPRDRIESLRGVTLRQQLSVPEMESIEARADTLGVSSLVVKIGGLGATFPTFVADNSDLRYTIDTIIEEWLHQYLTFQPLGFRYLLHLSGISRDYDVAMLDETVANMISEEIGSIVYTRYYGDKPATTAKPEFDFNKAMREIRLQVN
ncbi:MAG: hypothetical protein Q7N50_04790, partial [Armatimonadota bacterium]|nr:hypothetical protein [Armatimonadota bacterium]